MAKIKAIPIYQIVLDLDQIVLDRDYYPRVHDDWVTVYKYKDAMEGGAKFPPIHVVDGGNKTFIVLDGWHRTKAANRLKRASMECIVHHIPKKKWLATAAELNAKNSRPLTTQDRVMVASRLKGLGYDTAQVARLIQCTVNTVEKWLVSRVVEDKDGNDVAIKSATMPLVGTRQEKNAYRYDRAIANASAMRTLDEMLAMLRSGLVDVSLPAVRDKATEIHERFGALLAGKKGRKTG